MWEEAQRTRISIMMNLLYTLSNIKTMTTKLLQQIAKMLSGLKKQDWPLFSSSSPHKTKFMIRLFQMFSIE
jgi:hypothetical protein